MFLFLLSTLSAQEPTPESEDESTPTGEERASDQGEDSSTEKDVEKSNKTDSVQDASNELSEEPTQQEEDSQQGGVDESKEAEGKVEEIPSSEEESSQFDVEDIPKEKLVREIGVITLKNGDTLHGSILDNEDGLRINVGGDEDLHVPESSILTLSYPKGKFMLQDLGYTRYFYSPTAMPMKPKTGYISQKELLFSAVAYSPTQNFSFLVGTSIPFTLLSAFYGDFSTLLGIAGLRYGTKVSGDFYVGGGVEAIFWGGSSVSLPFVNASYGDSEQHVTIGAGVGLTNFDFEQTDLLPVFLSAYKRITPSLAFITENWILASPSFDYVSTGVMLPGCDYEYEYDCYEYEGQYDWEQIDIQAVASSVGVRFISKKFTTDIGLINVFSSYGDYIPIPWLDVAWYFGDDVH